MIGSRRAALAAGLLAIAVVVPTAAWYVSATRAGARTAAAHQGQLLDAARRAVERQAERLASRLDELRQLEAARPFYHYQSLYHDPRGAAEGLAVIPSPLAAGAGDPLVGVHFQIDDRGRITLPTVNEQFPELSAEDGFSVYCTLLADLQQGLVVAPDAATSLVDGPRLAEAPPDNGATQEQVLVLERAAWEQILLADAVYATLTGRSPGAAGPRLADTARRRALGQVVVRTAPLRWRTLVLGSGPQLAALREVATPSGVLLQGFTIADEAVASWLSGAEPQATFAQAVGEPSSELAAQVSDTGWRLEADARPLVAAAASAAATEEAEFLGRFAVSAAATLLAALAVVAIVSQTDRLARQRAAFAAAAAHELKTPLASLQLHAEMLADGLGDPAHAGLYARRLAMEAARLGRVVANMLDLARLERGALSVTPVAADLLAAVTRCVDQHRAGLEEAGVEVVLHAPPEAPGARFDPDALAHILHNLLDNAEKHSRGAPVRRVEVHVGATGERAAVEVRDTGPGFDRDAQRAAFTPFERRRDPGAPAGLGLGLALARALARAQGGELEILQVTTGAAVRLTLPTASP